MRPSHNQLIEQDAEYRAAHEQRSDRARVVDPYLRERHARTATNAVAFLDGCQRCLTNKSSGNRKWQNEEQKSTQ